MYTCFVPLLGGSAQTSEPLSCTAQLVGHPCCSPAVEALHEKLLQAYESDVDECRGWEFGATGSESQGLGLQACSRRGHDML